MSEKRTFSISELSQEFDVTTRSIRFYEDQGGCSSPTGAGKPGSSAPRTAFA